MDTHADGSERAFGEGVLPVYLLMSRQRWRGLAIWEAADSTNVQAVPPYSGGGEGGGGGEWRPLPLPPPLRPPPSPQKDGFLLRSPHSSFTTGGGGCGGRVGCIQVVVRAWPNHTRDAWGGECGGGVEGAGLGVCGARQ